MKGFAITNNVFTVLSPLIIKIVLAIHLGNDNGLIVAISYIPEHRAS